MPRSLAGADHLQGGWAAIVLNDDGSVSVGPLLIRPGGILNVPVVVPTYANPVPLATDPTQPGFVDVTTTAGVGNATINASTGGNEGDLLVIRINNDAGAARTVTFGTNFRPTATVVGTASKAITVWFISNGVAWVEAFRGVAA